MSWADFGHMITYIPKRSAVSNPFQRGILGTNGSAAYFMAESEDDANRILDHLQTKYVITDATMTAERFPVMAIWYNRTAGAVPYQVYESLPASGTPDNPETLNNQHYYLTMVSRLQNSDGSFPPSNLTTPKPSETIPALRHYRLVHESPAELPDKTVEGTGPVKIFEYVPGAHIRGEGIIEVSVITNTGRTFIYRQESENGEFIVPYPTVGSSYDVKTTGKYRISGTDAIFEVPEDAILQAKTIN